MSPVGRGKLIVFGLVGLLLLVGLLGLAASYWHWFLLLGVVGLLGLYGRRGQLELGFA